jgi:hypothetical protein
VWKSPNSPRPPKIIIIIKQSKRNKKAKSLLKCEDNVYFFFDVGGMVHRESDPLGQAVNPLAPSDPYMGRTAQLTSRYCILNTYSTIICTEYFKNAA